MLPAAHSPSVSQARAPRTLASLDAALFAAASFIAASFIVALGPACTDDRPEPIVPTAPEAIAAIDEPVVEEGERLVSIVPSATELLFAIDLGDQVVARTDHCDFPAEVAQLDSVGSGYNLDVERVLSMRPTYVVGAASQQDTEAVRAIVRAGISVVLLPDASVSDVRAALQIAGTEFDRLDESAALIGLIDDQLRRVAERPSSNRPRTLLVVDRAPNFVAGPDTFISELLIVAGGRNALDTGDWVQLDDEAFLDAEPEWIIELVDVDAEPVSWDRFSTVPAIAAEHICRIDQDLASRPSPRVGQIAEAFYDCLHAHE